MMVRAAGLVVASVVIALALLPSRAAIAQSSLRAYWPMYEAPSHVVHDVSGQGHHGRIESTHGRPTPEWVRGVLGWGSALRLDGDDDVVVSASAALEPAHMTVAAFVRAPVSPGQNRHVFAKGASGCDGGSYGLSTSGNGGLAFYVYDGRSWWRSPQVVREVWDGRWHHVAGTYDGAHLRLFVDGAEIGRGAPAGGVVDHDVPDRTAHIGAYRGACDLNFAGDIDQVQIFDKALPIEQIWRRWGHILGGTPGAPGLPEDSGEQTKPSR